MEQTEVSDKSTVKNGRKLITLWIPLEELPVINAHAKALGISRSKLLLRGALRLAEDITQEGLPMPGTK